MRILVDIGHPAHVHMFRNFAKEMVSRGHEVLFTCRDKEFEVVLLEHYGLPYVNFGRKHKSIVGKVIDLVRFDYKEWRVARRFAPDVFLSHGSITASHVAWLMGKKHIAFEDTFNMEQVRLYMPFTDVVLTADYEHPLKSKKVIRYKGFHETLYIHPKRFTPNRDVRDMLGVKGDEKYVLIRFVSWNATHDKGHKGISYENKLMAVREFERYAKVFITSEKALPKELESYRVQVAPYLIHDVMASASLIYGESATMVSEGVMMGVPGVYVDDTGRLYTKCEEVYGMCYNYTESEEDQRASIEKGVELLKEGNKDGKYDELMGKMIDVTGFLVWFVENFPESKRIMREDANFQLRFK